MFIVKKYELKDILLVRIIHYWRSQCYPILTPKSIFVAGGLKSV